MESLSYTFEGRGPSFTNDMELQMDDLVRSRNLLKEWDAFEGMGFIGPDLPELSRKSVVLTQCLENSVDDANGDSFKSVPSTSTISLNSSMEFGTRFSSSAIKVDDEKLAQSCSKIEKLEASQVSKGNQVSAENSAKRARVTNSPTQIPVCIVQGCNKDLSNSKEYHKRHKVCEVHSKTAVVIVNGIQQRFCQQCSRFHVLAEFDEGKRSCRKRLAGHNARRRKPQVDTYYGSTLFGTDLSNTSLLFSEMLFGQQSHEPTNQIRHVKLEEEPSRTTQLALPLKFDHSLPKDLFELHEMGKKYPSKNCLNSPLSVLESSAGSNSSCALSLLSAQSQKLSMDYPPILEEYQHTKPSAKMTPKDFTPSIFSSSSGEVNQRFPYTSAPVGFGFPENKLLQEPNVQNPKHYPSHDGANTLDLLQLSLHLQRVEQQKYSSQVKPEDGIFCHSTTT